MNVPPIGSGNYTPPGETAGVPGRVERPPLFSFGSETAGSVANGGGSSFDAVA